MIKKKTKMHWNYRVISTEHKRDDSIETTFAIHEVYYNGKKITGWSEDGIAPFGETSEELKADLQNIGKALLLPVLKLKDLEKRIKKGKPRNKTK